MIEFCAKEMPRWNPVSISGYHIREAGATAVQELAFTLADGLEYVQECVDRGMDVDAFAQRLSFFWDVHNDFFEEIAKFRAARRIWARTHEGALRGEEARVAPAAHPRPDRRRLAHRPAALQQRGAHRPPGPGRRCWAAPSRSTPTRSTRPTRSPPRRRSRIALRTQQIIAYESGADRVVDPLAGSYYVEYLTDEMEKRALDYIRRIDEMGGHAPRGGGGLPAAGDRRERLPLAARGGERRADRGRRERLPQPRRTSPSRCSGSTRAWPAPRSSGSRR